MISQLALIDNDNNFPMIVLFVSISVLKVFVSIDQCKPKQTSNETNTKRKHRISITVTSSIFIKKVIFLQSCSLLPIIKQIELNPGLGIFQLVYCYLSNRIDSFPTAYFFRDIYYTEHSYTRLKLIFVGNSWQ